MTTPFRFDDPDQFIHGTPYHALARRRRESPFAWHPALHDPADGFWLALKHEDVVSISKQPHLFTTRAPLLADPLPKELWPAFPALAMIADNLMTFSPEKHAQFRPIANAVFSTARIGQTASRVRAACTHVMDRAFDRPSFDFAEDVALAIPVDIVLGMFLGVAREDLARVTRAVLTINAMDDPVFRPTGEALPAAADELCAYGLALLRRLEARRDESVLSELVHDGSLRDVSAASLFFAYWFPLAAGAFDTTASTIAGGVRALLQRPEQCARLRAEPDLLPAAVEEIVRWVSPVVYFRRTASEDASFNGHHIREGQKIILCYASANRDEDVFVDPESFDVTRHPNRHLSFGYGSHFCLGARLSSFILRIVLEELLPRLPDLELAGDVVHTRSSWMNRIRSMPVMNRQTAQPRGPLAHAV